MQLEQPPWRQDHVSFQKVPSSMALGLSGTNNAPSINMILQQKVENFDADPHLTLW